MTTLVPFLIGAFIGATLLLAFAILAAAGRDDADR